MSQAEKLLSSIGISLDNILLPEEGTDMTRWSVVACDQYTSEPEYWNRVDALTGDKPSTLRLIFPEVWLERESEEQKQARIAEINRTMSAYLEQNILKPHAAPFLVERRTRNGHIRLGLMVSVDLERYDFSEGSQSLIRATEGTILDRLPPRIRIREHAGLELPHIMVLIDDPARTVIEPLYRSVSAAEAQDAGNDAESERFPCATERFPCATERFPCVYDFNLMESSGHLKGWQIGLAGLEDMADALTTLADPEVFHHRYSVGEEAGVLLFAVGDGNHSLATAKSCWERLKAGCEAQELANHPARHALVELVNVHDEGLVFEPIHRVLFHVDRQNWLESFRDWHFARGIRIRVEPEGQTHSDLTEDQNQTETVELRNQSSAVGKQHATLISDQGRERLVWENPEHQLAVGSLQAFLDDWLADHPETAIDYVHGDEVTARLGTETGNLGFLLPVMEKEELFPTVIRDGALPRKTFSMGEAHEKRFYLECRRIR